MLEKREQAVGQLNTTEKLLEKADITVIDITVRITNTKIWHLLQQPIQFCANKSNTRKISISELASVLCQIYRKLAKVCLWKANTNLAEQPHNNCSPCDLFDFSKTCINQKNQKNQNIVNEITCLYVFVRWKKAAVIAITKNVRSLSAQWLLF